MDDLPALPRERTDVLARDAAVAARLAAEDWPVVDAPAPPYAAAVVIVPRARDLGRAWVRLATESVEPGGLIIVDGQKTDGVEPLLKACKGRVTVSGQTSKSHGKLFWFAAEPAFADWPSLDPVRNGDGFLTAPGVFSADGIDPASGLLAETLPASLGKSVADLGAGWGYLASRLLADPKLETLWLVESDAAALACARENVADDRVRFAWADATAWQPTEKLDAVVMNPPFHTGRAADPGLGRAFIQAAARALKPSGQLWLVANRHLPYEETLTAAFRDVSEAGGDTRFKVLHARGPQGSRRQT